MPILWEDRHRHCLNCFFAECPETAFCEMIRCSRCGVRLHACKLDDHLDEICPRGPVACPNSLYGCDVQIFRDHLATHLRHCNAYVLRCNFCWNRSFVSLIAKRFFKRCAKQLEESHQLRAQAADADSEVLLALQDQEQILNSFKCSRLCRMKQRDYLNRTHPLLPLMHKRFPPVYFTLDSSDEEEKDEQIIRRSTPQTFAGCPICRTDPGEQHLHILGNANPVNDPDDPSVETPSSTASLPLEKLLPKANLKHNLFLKLEFGRINARATSDFKTFHMFCCNQLLQRNEYWDHLAYHNEVAHPEFSRFYRCPYGCGYCVEKRVSSTGQLMFDKFYGTVVVKNVVVNKSSKLDMKLPKILATLAIADAYLDAATLNALAATCSWFREVIFSYFPHRYIIYKKWNKRQHVDGRIEWQLGEKLRRFSKVQFPTWKIVQAEFLGSMQQHKERCPIKELNYNELPLKNTIQLLDLMGFLMNK